MTLEIHAHEEAFEIALVGGADLDRLAAAIRGDRSFEGRAGETHQRAEGGWPLSGRFTESLDGGSADFRIRVGGERGERFVMRGPCAEVAEGVHRFATYVAIGVGQQAHGQGPDLTAVLAQHPEGLDPTRGGRGGVTGDRGERAFEGFAFVATVGQCLPGEMGISDDLGAEAGDQVGGRELGVIGYGWRDEALRLDAPDATRLLIAIGVIAGDFVVADDLVIPVDDVEAAVGTHGHGDRTEERVLAGDEILETLEAVAGARAVLADRVDLRGDRIGDIHHAVEALRPDADVGEREAAETRSAHLEVRSLHRERRLVGFRQAVRAAGIEGILMERHHRVPVVIGLLDERLAFTGEHETPDIAGTDARRLEEAAVRTETRHPGVREVGDVALGGRDLAGIEGALGEPEPTPRSAGELVREEVRVLHAEARQ